MRADHAREDSAAFRVLVDSKSRLESLLVGLTGDSAAAALWQLGRLKRTAQEYTRSDGPGDAYALQHPLEYLGSGVGSGYLYSGAQWKRLLQRFPDSPYADEAAWQIANLDHPGECEHSLACFVDRMLTPYAEFLERFSSSPLADSAVATADNGLATVLAVLDPDSLRQWSFDLEPARVDSILTRYETIVPRLSTGDRIAGLRRTAQLRTRLAQLYREANP
jgi:hypothetical protein